MSRVITGIYRDRSCVTNAVEKLLRSNVPADEIVVILGGVGTPGTLETECLSDLARDDLDRGATVVTVHGDEVAATAREVLVRTGATALTESWTDSARRPWVGRPSVRMTLS